MRKKVIATVLAASMVLTLAPVLPVGTGTAAQAEDTAAGSGLASVFDAIQTQPAVKYTFDNADGLELAGEAKVADGVLNLATTPTKGTTYAKIADLSTIDFSKGVTFVVDVKVAGYTSDWTPIIMVGDGQLGKEGKDVTALYHFSQGFSSVGGTPADVFEGYFGSGVSAPYTWDYFSNTANQNKWMKMAVTISGTNMATYVDGQKVQEQAGNYANLIKAFSVGKNSYLGVSYWPADPDFVGSMDNLGIYNTELSASDIAAIASAKVTEQPAQSAAPTESTDPSAAPDESAAPAESTDPSAAPAESTVPDDQVAPLTTLDDLDVVKFWEDGHTAGQKINSKELFFSFKLTSKRDAQQAIQNWYGPIGVIYSSADGKVSSEAYQAPDYNEYWVVRGDAYGWKGEANTATPDLLAAAGIEFVSSNLPADDAGWLAWRTENGKGTRVEGSVRLADDKVILELTVNGVTSVSTVTVDASKDVYLAFTGERCTLSHIKFSGNKEEAALTDEELNGGNTPGDDINTPGDDNNNEPGDDSNGDNDTTKPAKKAIKISKVQAKKNATKITGTVSVTKATVKVKVGGKAFKKATVKGKKFTFKTAKLKKGTKVTVKATKSGYKAQTKKVTVK